MSKFYIRHEFRQSVEPHTPKVVDVNLCGFLIRNSDARLQNILVGSLSEAL